MGKIKNDLIDEDDGIDYSSDEELQEIYPKKLSVDGYPVNHYHNGEIPVYEICDEEGNTLEVAYSSNELHEMIRDLSSKNESDS